MLHERIPKLMIEVYGQSYTTINQGCLNIQFRAQRKKNKNCLAKIFSGESKTQDCQFLVI